MRHAQKPAVCELRSARRRIADPDRSQLPPQERPPCQELPHAAFTAQAGSRFTILLKQEMFPGSASVQTLDDKPRTLIH